MQIDFSDKRVIAATATAGIVAIVIIVLQSLILMGSRPTATTYAPRQATPAVQSVDQYGWSKEKLDLLKALTEEERRSPNPDRERCRKQGGDYELISGKCIR